MSGLPFQVVGLADLLDIALVACLMYALLVWFKRAKAAFVAKGMLVLGLVYLLARAFGMVMTTWLFHGFFAVLLIALVVIFQEELRSIFERIAVWSLSGGVVPLTSPHETEILVHTLDDLARDRIGALIVLRGKDPLDRHLEGGWNLNGELSEALLKSIFDRNSIGHDGAVIVEGGRVIRFGCHLPLSKDAAQTAHLGTRHAAALGLTELTDALCLAVSEEKGRVSVAREGELEAVADLQELEARIESFSREQAPAPPESTMRQFVHRNTREKAIAVFSSMVFWMLFVLGGKDLRRSYLLPVQVRNVPESLRVSSIRPARVRITFSGQLRDFYWTDPRRLFLRLDISRARAGENQIELSDSDVVRPASFIVEEIDPAEVLLGLDRGRPEKGP